VFVNHLCEVKGEQDGEADKPEESFCELVIASGDPPIVGDAAADYLAVVRHVEVKYRRPALGELTAKAEVAPEEAERFRDTLERRGRAAIEVHVQVFGADEGITLEAAFEWFAQGVRR
jgi:hypothetical protein